MSELSQAVATIFLGMIGLWLANSYRRQMKSALALRASEAFARLWSVTSAADPTTPLVIPADDRRRVAAQMRDWYFDHGDGLFLPPRTRNLFFFICGNLNGPPNDIHPRSFADFAATTLSAAEFDQAVGCLVKRQLSILRTQVKAELAIHFRSATLRNLRPDEEDILRESHIRKSWGSWLISLSLLPSRNDPRCYCGLCPTGRDARGRLSRS